MKDNKKPVACAFVLVQYKKTGKILFSIRAN